MRGTMKITNNNSLYYLNRNFDNFNTVTNQIAMERQVVKLEDNPLSANIGIRMLNATSRAKQFIDNIKVGTGSLNITDGYLGKAKTLMDKVYTVTEGAANGPTTNEQRQANAVELNEILKQLVTYGNAQYNGRYIFGGQQTTTPPFTIVNGRYVQYTGDDKAINMVVDNGTTLPINCTGSAAYGSMTTKMTSRDLNPDICLSTDRSTKLSDLNGGSGVPTGKILVKYSAYPEGLEVDLTGCDTLEDVKDRIESETLKASRALDPAQHNWLNAANLDWHDLQDRYVKVTMNPEHNGLSLQEYDLGEPLPQPSKYEALQGLTYSGNPGYTAGGRGVATGQPSGETTVFDKRDYVYHNSGGYYAPLKVENYAGNKVADGLGLAGIAKAYTGGAVDKVLDGFLHGRDLNPRLTSNTLLADLEGYNDSTYTFSNGTKPGNLVFREVSDDSNNVFSEWNITGLAKGDNTGPNGELYVRAVNHGTASAPDIKVEIYTKPLHLAKPSDLVATGSYTASGAGGTVVLHEANSSGVGGSVGIVLPTNVGEAKVDLAIDFGQDLQASVHVPAFIEEQNPDGTSKDILNIASGWSIRGLDKPPAKGYDKNHEFSTDLDGDLSVNYRYDSATNKFFVELCRPSFDGEPAKIVATGEIAMGNAYDPANPPSNQVVSGRVELVGAPGFEGVKGSVYLEIPTGTEFTNAPTGVGQANATTITYTLASNSPAGTVVLGGATELVADTSTATLGAGQYTSLAGETLFKKGQVFDKDVVLPDGSRIYAGVPLERDMTFPKGVKVSFNNLKEGTVLAQGQELTFPSGLAAGTVIPRGSYYTSPAGAGFPADGMGVSANGKSAATAGYDLRATFATVEDLNRAVQEAGIYVTSRISSDGKSIEFVSALAGAWLTVGEDFDAYEQMGDKYNQLSALDLSGLVKGVNSDANGNVYTEVVYYPPDPTDPTKKVKLVSSEGEIIEIDPGYYVRVYDNAEEMKKPFADRDNSTLMAEGFVPLGTTPPGRMDSVVLRPKNDSGLSGTVNLDYFGTRPVGALDGNGNPAESLYTNDNITVFPGGLRVEGGRHVTIQEWDMNKIVPGTNCDYAGTFHGRITRNDATVAGVSVALYKDSSNKTMTARNDPNEAPVDGRVTLYEVDRQGNIALDTNGQRIVAGYMTVTGSSLADGQSDAFTLTTGGLRQNGQDREENVFSTLNDIIDALDKNDEEALHNLIGDITKDIKRILAADGDVGARSQRLENLKERHADDVVSFQAALNARVGMDSTALSFAVMNYQAASNAYQAALQVSGQIMQMSLLQFL